MDIINQKEFEYNISRAEEYHKQSTGLEVYFWEGYLRGLRDNYHGERFETDAEHIQWMGLRRLKNDISRKCLGVGYATGFDGTPISKAIKAYEKFERNRKKRR